MAHAIVEKLERWMGPFEDAASRVSVQDSARADALDAFPERAWTALQEFGLFRYYVPEEFGGAHTTYPELLTLWRAVARRDLTLAVGHGKTLLGAICVWLAGTPSQQQSMADLILEGGIVSWGLTERDHGSDLIASELRASAVDGRWRVDGEKWLINNATRGSVLCALIRSEDTAGPRGLSLVLLDKARLAPDTWYTLPKERTHGIRGADISGIGFRGAEVESADFVGERGRGLEIVLRGLQVTRTLCAALSLGAADHAAAIAEDLVVRDRGLRPPLAHYPIVLRNLARSRATLMAAETITEVAARSVHALPRELGVHSALAKVLVPALVEDLLRDTKELLGLRSFVVGDQPRDQFQKIERDHRIVPIFDGSTVVNLNAIINGFPDLARPPRCDAVGLACATHFSSPLPAFDPDRLRVLPSGRSSLLAGLPDALERIRGGPVNPTEPLESLLSRLEGHYRKVLADINARPSPERFPDSRAFRLAERYTACLGAAAATHVWLSNDDHTALGGNRSAWLEAVLCVVLSRLEDRPLELTSETEALLVAHLSDSTTAAPVAAEARQ